MFGKLFKSKSPKEKLIEKRKNLLNEAFKLSTVNRTESDKKQAEADALLDEIDKAAS
ncbi:MAG: Lacal_2735 family protein [Bacteroidetes bacterium]|jgi:hypothetical protein|nr:Lacal_2735 family protein [Bacteroidota bacterium]